MPSLTRIITVALLPALVACAATDTKSTNPVSNSSDTRITQSELVAKTQWVYVPIAVAEEKGVIEDDDPWTVQIYPMQDDDSRPSSVSANGQIILLRMSDAIQAGQYLLRSSQIRFKAMQQ